MIALLALGVGGNWHVLQVIAWAKMIQERAPEVGFVQAVDSVLGGKAPCQHCLVIQEKRSGQEDVPLNLVETGSKLQSVAVVRDRFIPLQQPVVSLLSFGDQAEPEVHAAEILRPPPRLG